MRGARTAAVAAALAAVALACVPATAAPKPSDSVAGWRPDVAAAGHYAEHRHGRVSFDVIDARGREAGFRARWTAPMASTFKVMLMAAYLRRPSVAHRRLHGSDRRLLVPMIRRSDNAAATRVNAIVGAGAIHRLAHRAGMQQFHYDRGTWGLSRSSPRDQARFMLRLDQLLPARHRRFARHQPAHIVPSQRWGIGRLALRGWRLYFKGGWGSGSGRVDHQVAFLEHGDERIAVAIFTEFDETHHYGKRTLHGVAARLLRGLPRGWPAA